MSAEDKARLDGFRIAVALLEGGASMKAELKQPGWKDWQEAVHFLKEHLAKMQRAYTEKNNPLSEEEALKSGRCPKCGALGSVEYLSVIQVFKCNSCGGIFIPK